MTVTLNLAPEVVAGLSAQAKAHGMILEDYLLSIAEEASVASQEKESAISQMDRRKAVHKMLEFGKKYNLSLGEPITRALLHEGHRF